MLLSLANCCRVSASPRTVTGTPSSSIHAWISSLDKAIAGKLFSPLTSVFLRWLRAAGIRAVKTVAQTAIAAIGTSAVFSSVDWKMVASTAALAGVLSVLTSVAGIPEVADVQQTDQEVVCKKGKKG